MKIITAKNSWVTALEVIKNLHVVASGNSKVRYEKALSPVIKTTYENSTIKQKKVKNNPLCQKGNG